MAKTYKTKAQRSFEEKLAKATEERNFAKVADLYNKYGTYLELIEDEGNDAAGSQ